MQHLHTLTKKQLPSKAERHKLFGSVVPGKKTKPENKADMADLQNTKKNFLFHIDAVGIAKVKHPIQVISNTRPAMQTTIGTFEFTSSIQQDSKGTNMSRFTEQLDLYHKNGFTVSVKSLQTFVAELADRLKQEDARVKVTFPWFFERSGPASGMTGLNHADATLEVAYDKHTGFRTTAKLSGTVTTLCPCSKEISEYSAHNQRGIVSMEVQLTDAFDEDVRDWKEDLLEAAESNASARIHPVLKRPDEKMVTETAYENPRFVEDMVRLVAADLYELDYVEKFTVSCSNEESIHLHDAVATLSYDKRDEEE
ncbi:MULTISPECIES: GTP cyclohydrolase FolE2 [Terribacillus]|jgi:GTP cyclohydrolase IB|uniref:GTP cyclohydrolase FolE2 n=1 Tax=Terribacillus saccharophilus TaxID=361277 RepID=A0ABX4H3P4_9BACI|nr:MULTISPECIES: GTP cyclohydrolase FolE2 [Terribacillus]PAD36615.1 GTP cyclohydrolase I FolE2 [Terribacillus saccharophilus]PAD97597.1 GTP cyclohydrolase I FolE2 [Terribacillus saccharophilus]PAE01644.1 GTP cyclohydrolase I FolE2 [Terribacillus saccharophilus]